MMFVFFSGAQGSWAMGPLIMLIPLVIQLAPVILDGLLTPVENLQRTSADTALGGPVLLTACNLVISAIGVWGFIRFVRWVRQNGGWSFLLRLLLQGHQAGAEPFEWQWGPAGGRPQQQQRGQAQQRRVTVEEVAEALTKLPTEVYVPPQQLAALPVHELKALLHGRGLEPVKCLEKSDLVRQLLEHGGSSADSCSICCEEYAIPVAAGAAEEADVAAAGAAGAGAGAALADGAGERKAGTGAEPAAAEAGSGACCAGKAQQGGSEEEDTVVLRVLRCGHRFHVECVDKWFLSATDYTREPACPLCNAPLLERHVKPPGRN